MIVTRSALQTAVVFVVLVTAACGSEKGPEGTATPAITPTSISPPTGTATTIPPTAISVPTSTPTTAPTSTPSPAATATSVPIETPITYPAPRFVDNPDCRDLSRVQLPLADVVITDGAKSVEVVAEMARNAVEQSQGLMCRDPVPDGTGMLFLWESERNGGFWMFNTYAPLDIIYFGGSDGRVSLKQMAPCPRNPSEDDEAWRSRCGQVAGAYLPGINYTTTLELPQGWLERQGFDTTDPDGIEVSLVARS